MSIDIIVITAFLSLWILPPALLALFGIWPGGWIWAAFWVGLALLLGGFEIYGKFFSSGKKTLTQYIRKWARESKRNLWIARGVLITWTISWLILIFGHLWVF